MTNAVATAYQLAFEISPIFLTGGIATSIINSATASVGLSTSAGVGALPIVALTQAPSFVTGILTGNPPTDLDTYFARFVPLPGSTLIDNDISTYPFANQSIAANAIIAKGLVQSFEMICPATSATPYVVKLATMMMLKASLAQHCQQGGLFTLLTNAGLSNNWILKRVVDISSGDTNQRQWRYQLDFFAPLITLAQAQTAQNNSMSAITNGTQTNGALSGPGNVIDQAPANPYQGPTSAAAGVAS